MTALMGHPAGTGGKIASSIGLLRMACILPQQLDPRCSQHGALHMVTHDRLRVSDADPVAKAFPVHQQTPHSIYPNLAAREEVPPCTSNDIDDIDRQQGNIVFICKFCGRVSMSV